MSRGAINEMLRASMAQFERMLKDTHRSDKKIILKSLVHRVAFLEAV